MRWIVLALTLCCLGAKAQAITTPNDEASDAAYALKSISFHSRPFVKFFSLYAVPPELRQKSALTLSFVAHSLIGFGGENIGSYHPIAYVNGDNKFVAKQRVQGSDTLYWIDIRDYNWDNDAWDEVAKQENYFDPPMIDQIYADILDGALVRGDWFIRHATDTGLQEDRNLKTLYNELLYAGLNRAPQNLNEWKKIWGVDTSSNNKYNLYTTLVTKSKAVARHNRLLYGTKTSYGWMYETNDVKNQEGRRDYLHDLANHQGGAVDPKFQDGGEMFASNIVNMQVYAIRDAAGKLINAADTTLVRHMEDITNDVRVRVGFSCMDCHAKGIIPAENSFAEYIKNGGEFVAKFKKEELFVEARLLSGRFAESVIDNQNLYERAMLKVNGLDPAKNSQYLLQVVGWYDRPLTLEQVVRELGTTKEDFDVVVEGGVPGAVGLLVYNNEPIPRKAWGAAIKDGIPGLFLQTTIKVFGKRAIVIQQPHHESEQIEIEEIEEEVPVRHSPKNAVRTTKRGNIIWDERISRGRSVPNRISRRNVPVGTLLYLTGKRHFNGELWQLGVKESPDGPAIGWFPSIGLEFVK